LENGTQILLERVKDAETISLGFWFLHGSRDERDEESGFSHFLEHSFFKGTKKRDTFTIAREIDRVGGFLNAFTERELTCIHTMVPHEYFTLVVDIIYDMVFNATLDKKEIEKEKLVVLNELKISEDVPEEKAFDIFLKELWNDHPLCQKITGCESSIIGINREKLYSFYKRYFVPANLVIAIAGNFNLGNAIRVLTSLLVNQSQTRIYKKRISPVRHLSTKYINDKFNQAHIYIGAPFPLAQQVKDYYVELILSTCFGESMSSRLFQKIREDEGLCYSIYSHRAYFQYSALWIIYTNTLLKLIPKLIAALNRELRSLYNNPPLKKEVEDAKCHIKGTMVLSKQDMEVRMKRIARQYIVMNRVLTYKESLAIIESVTQEDIAKIINSLIKCENFNLLVYGCQGVTKYKNHILKF